MQVTYIGGSFSELADKARAGLHRRPTLRTPSGNGSKCKNLCCQTKEASTEEAKTEKAYADANVQTEPVMEKEVATALAVASASEPGDELVVKNLEVPAPPDVPVPENDAHAQSRSDFR